MTDDPSEMPEGVMAFINKARAERVEAGNEPRPTWPDTPATSQGLTGVAWRLHERLDAIDARLDKATVPPSLLDIAKVVGVGVGALRGTIIGVAAWLSFLIVRVLDMEMIRALVVAMGLLASTATAQTNPHSGSAWLESCTQKYSEALYVLCLGFVQGAEAAHDIDTRVGGMPPFFCMPQQVSYGQMVQVVVKYLKDRPQELHEPFGALVYKAFRQAFPCPRGK